MIQDTSKTYTVCKFCGKPYIAKEYNFGNNTVKLFVADCDCAEKEEARLNELEKQIQENLKAEEEKKQKQEKIENLFKTSMITPFFRKKLFENMKQTEEIKFCKKFANEFKPNTKGLMFIGDYGTGKTTALACICNELIEKGYNCLFTTFSNLLDRFSNYSYHNAGDIMPLLNDLSQCDFVVLDDLGRENYTEKRKEFAFRIIDNLMNYEVTTAITANGEMISKLNDMPEWNAIADRLKEMCKHTIIFKGNSKRLGG